MSFVFLIYNLHLYPVTGTIRENSRMNYRTLALLVHILLVSGALCADHGVETVVNCTDPALEVHCECLEAGHGSIRAVECRSASELEAVPRTISPETTKLTMTGTSIAAIQADDFTDFASSLEQLEFLNNVKLSTIALKAFSGLSSLHSLTISLSNVSVLEDGIFDSLTNLSSLVFNFNKLETVVPCLFQRLANLKTMNLAGNKIRSLAPGTFANLHQLVSLILDDNQLQVLLPESFFLLPNTTIANMDIHLDQNPLECDCRTLWIHWLAADVVTRTANVFTPVCAGPKANAGQPFDNVNRAALCSYRTPRVLLEKTTVTRGQTTSLTCASLISANRPLYRWFQYGRLQTHSSLNNHRYHLFYGVLTIENVTDDDAGIWTCDVTDPILGIYVKSEPVTLSVHDVPFCGHPVPQSQDGLTTNQVVALVVGLVVGAILLVAALYWTHSRMKKLRAVRSENRTRRTSSLSNLPTNIVLADDSFGLAENPEYLRYLKHTSNSSLTSGGVGVVSYQPKQPDSFGDTPLPQSSVGILTTTGLSTSGATKGNRVMVEAGEYGVPRVVDNPLIALGYTQSDFDQHEDRDSLATTTMNRSAVPTEADGEYSGIADQSSITYMSNNIGADEDGGDRKKVSLAVFNNL